MTLPEIESVIRDYGPKARAEWNRLARFDAYVAGDHDKPRFEDNEEERRYRRLWESSTINLIGLTVSAYSQRLAVDGYRTDQADQQPASTPWTIWRHSGMDAAQSRLYAATFTHGYAYLYVGASDDDPGAALKVVTARQVYAHFDDPDDDWPAWVLKVKGDVWTIWDDEFEHTVPVDRIGSVVRLRVQSVPHGTGRCPFSRVEDDWGPIRAHGLVAPLIRLNDQVNRLTFVLNLIGEHSSFQLRYLIGAKPGVNPETGQAVEPRVGPNRFLMIENAQGKIGALDPTDPTGLRNYRTDLINDLCSVAQVPQHTITGRLANLSAESLLAAESSFAYRLNSATRSFGVGIDRALRLGAAIAGDPGSAADRAARVWWQPVQAVNLAAAVDAWSKAVQSLEVPAEATWTRIPGVTRQDAEEWHRMREEERETDPVTQLNRLMNRGEVTGEDPAA
ncbi:phage portal protein [Pseudonocardia alni]|uniref:phage portal protein n=1 Tax=Pseudonocardia alni TaxID=33907 RepID=UPI0033339DAB